MFVHGGHMNITNIHIHNEALQFQEECAMIWQISTEMKESFLSCQINNRRCNSCHCVQFRPIICILVENWGIKIVPGDICLAKKIIKCRIKWTGQNLIINEG